MPAKKGSKYLNAKTSSILWQYNHEDMQKLLNSGEFKSIIARRLGVHIKAFNAYISEHNLTYKTPTVIYIIKIIKLKSCIKSTIINLLRLYIKNSEDLSKT